MQADGKVLIGGIDSAAPYEERHFVARLNEDGSLDSSFGAGEDVSALIRQAENVTPVTQANERLDHVVDAGRPIGTDRATNALTNQYTVITEANGTLVTAFPDLPGV